MSSRLRALVLSVTGCDVDLNRRLEANLRHVAHAKDVIAAGVDQPVLRVEGADTDLTVDVRDGRVEGRGAQIEADEDRDQGVDEDEVMAPALALSQFGARLG